MQYIYTYLRMHKQPHFREALFYELKFIFGLYSFALHLLKLVKDQVKVKQQPEAEILLFENYSFSSFMLPLKTNTRYSKKYAANKCACFNEIM